MPTAPHCGPCANRCTRCANSDCPAACSSTLPGSRLEPIRAWTKAMTGWIDCNRTGSAMQHRVQGLDHALHVGVGQRWIHRQRQRAVVVSLSIGEILRTPAACSRLQT